MILLWIISILIWIAYAWLITRFNKGVDYHFAEALFTCLVAFLLPFSLLFTKTDVLLLPLNDFWDIILFILKIVSVPFIILTIKWIVFDGARNKFTGHGLFYYGKIETIIPQLKNGAMDKGLGKWQYLIKLILLVIAIALSVLYW